MDILYYPCESDVKAAISADEPLLVLVSFDGENAIVSQIDEAMEHHILLSKSGFPATDIDKYFRVVLDKEGADWTFVCPADYRHIVDKTRRIAAFYRDGFTVISRVLEQLGYLVGINIPKRYRRHFEMLK